MALQMATNITPDVFAGVGGAVFDAESGLTVRWQVNGTPYLLAYQLDLHSVNDQSTEVYSTGKVTLDNPFYGVTAKGNVQIFSANTITAEELASAGVVNGNEYQMYITQWWGSTDAESVTNQSPAVIRALSAPTVTVDDYGTTLNTRMHTFTATYEQAQGEQIAWVRWKLYDRNQNDIVLDDTGEIYGTSELKYTHDAFFTGTIYGIEIMLETQAGQQATSGIQTIYVSYNTAAPDGQVTAIQECGWNGVNVEWDSAKNMMGRVTGEYLFTDNDELTLNSSSIVTWTQKSGDAIAFAPPYSVVWVGSSSGTGARSTGMPIVLSLATTSGEMSLQIASVGNNASVSLYAANVLVGTASIASAVETGDMLYVLFSPTELTLTLQKAGGGSTQSSSVNISYTQQTITTIRLQGPQTCSLLWIEEGMVNGPIDPDTFVPVYTKDTYFQTLFANQDLNAGNSDTTGYAVYRLDNTTGEYRQIATLGVNQTGLIDYAARNGHSYTYQVWYMSDTIFTRQPLTSNVVEPCRWNVLLMAATPDEQGVYHPQAVYAFGLNVETSDVSNNSKNAKQDTFTPYPAYQKSNNLYRTGKLTALIGKIDHASNQYTGDTSDYADEIMALTTSDMTLFLRDRKGNFRLVEINGDIIQRVKDQWPNQAVSTTIPWVEVGDASQMSLILTNADDLWPYDQVFDTTVWVDPATGHLMWETTADYEPNVRGSVLDVTSTGRLTQELESTEVEMAQLNIDERAHLIAEQ